MLHSLARACATLLRDQRGQVSVEYVIVTAISLVIIAGIASLGLAVADSQDRARAVLLSNTP
jgi:Flp pilus assembly pilin Flp